MEALLPASVFAEVAQLVEHLSEEQRVGGSNPPLSTVEKKHPNGCFFVFDSAEGATCIGTLRAGSKAGVMWPENNERKRLYFLSLS